MDFPLKNTVIFTTYNSPAWLEKVLWGFHYQTDKDFEVTVADDGSGQETRDLIERFQRESGLDLLHVWQEDDGFQKCRILNQAIVAARGEYMITTDGDCIPRKDFGTGQKLTLRNYSLTSTSITSQQFT